MSFKRIISVAWIFLFIQTGISFAITRYVRTIGNDFFNSCTSSASPCATISHALTVCGAGDTISIGAGTFHELPLGVSKNLTFTGAGAFSTTVEVGSGTVFTINGGVTCTIQQMLIQGGTTRGINNNGALTVRSARVSNNNSSGNGGGIYNIGTLTMSRVTLSRNHASKGGGVYNNASAFLNKVYIAANSSAAGAGIFNNSGGSLTLVNSTVAGNQYGGIENDGTLTITNSTISGNKYPGSPGAGLYEVTGASATLRYVTLAQNGDPTHTNQAVYSTGGHVTFSNSIISANGLSPQCGAQKLGLYSDGGYNIYPDQSCGFFIGSGSVIAAAKLLNLTFNGGTTPTHALQSTSPAIDRVPVSRCIATDQRGVARPIDGNLDGVAKCDSGSYEYKP
jgi:fibronectin-binding autotransporter adhesin